MATTESYYKQGSLGIEPKLAPGLGDLFVDFCLHVKTELQDSSQEGRKAVLKRLRAKIQQNCADATSDEIVNLTFAQSLVLDLTSQGWYLEIESGRARITAPSDEDTDHAAKERVRRGHLLGRDAQLREPAVTEFVTGMQRQRLTDKGWHSIYSLMRDGAELTEQLRGANGIADENERNEALGKIISPYVQCFDRDELCEQTGLNLGDVWRYFRHTWVSEYKSIPGRSMMVLVRDAAASNHPVIGIAALGSSVVQHSLRDKWIGWHPDVFLERVMAQPTSKMAAWLIDSLKGLLQGIYLKDLLAEGLLTQDDLENPTESAISNLQGKAEEAIRAHRGCPERHVLKVSKIDATDNGTWERAAVTYLFLSKRCKQLATLLSVLKTFQKHGLTSQTQKGLKETLKTATGRAAVTRVLRMVKAEHAGVDMMDITVCGAIAPYAELLGGKLVCMLLCSPEVTQYYRRRYRKHVSVIASSMKGEPVRRTPNLVLLCTTSLYGIGSSQYNRVKIPAEAVGGREEEQVTYKRLGFSEGFGTYHFSRETLVLANIMTGRRQAGRVVNSIFGEGVNPLMRKIREALEQIGLNSDNALLHGNGRVTYGIALARNYQQILLGFDRHPAYILPQTDAGRSSNLIVDYWRKRWLSSRARRAEVLDKVATHTLSYPVCHGAVVPLDADREHAKTI